jgi:DHA2 family multidrug resistance protein
MQSLHKQADVPYRWFIIAAVMLSTVMEILDTTIVNVALPHMMGSLSADRDQISWVLTSYIVAAGILMPLTGFLVKMIGCRTLLLINIVGFMLASALCGISVNLTEIVCFRLLQGIFGASLVPLSQYILRTTFSAEEQPKMMAIWGIGIMAAPVMGPTLGGYITDSLNWRWVFYINIPVCIVNFFLVWNFIKQSPIEKVKIDRKGIALLLISICCLQLFLDRGQVDDWFESTTICTLFATFILTFVLFLHNALSIEHPIINLRLFKDRNYAAGTLALAFFVASVLGSLVLLPQMVETLFGYTADAAGLMMAPRGIASAFMMVFCSRLISKGYDVRKILVFGLITAAYSGWCLSQINLNTSFSYLAGLGIVQGLGLGAFFMPLSTVIYNTLPPQAIAEAAGLFSFGRNIGNSIGISLLTTYLSRDTQALWNHLGAHINVASPNLHAWLFGSHLSLQNPKTIALLGNILSTQANFIAYMHTFKIAAAVLLLSIACVFCMKLTPRKTLASASLDAH